MKTSGGFVTDLHLETAPSEATEFLPVQTFRIYENLTDELSREFGDLDCPILRPREGAEAPYAWYNNCLVWLSAYRQKCCQLGMPEGLAWDCATHIEPTDISRAKVVAGLALGVLSIIA